MANVLYALVPIVVVAGVRLPIDNITEFEPIGIQTACCSSACTKVPPGETTPVVLTVPAPANGQ